MRHDHSAGEGSEVVVESLWGGGAVHLPVMPKVAGHHLLLGVDADDGDPCLDAGGLRRPDLHELRVPVLCLVQRQVLGKRPPLEACLSDHLPYNVFGDIAPKPEKLAAALRSLDVEPNDAIVLREACHVPGHDIPECRYPFGMFAGFPLGSAARHALSAIRRHDVVGEFANRLADGVRRASEDLAHGLYRAAVGSRRLTCNKMPSVAFNKRAKEDHFRFANLYWRFSFHQCKNLKISYKDTENSPIIQYIKR